MKTNWSEKKHQESMSSHVKTVINDLKKEGINIKLEDPNPKLKNIVATKDDKTIKISHWSFYRYSGTGYRLEGSGDNVKLTLKDWVNKIIKPIIIYRLRDKE